MTFVLTQKDINTGQRNNMSHCPVCKCVTRVINEKTGETPKVFVPAADLMLINGAHVWLPEIVVRFNQLFDQGKNVQPFSFTLDFPADHDFRSQKQRKY